MAQLVTDIKVDGIGDINRALMSIGGQGARGAARKAATRANEITKKKAKATAPKDSGFLSESIIKKSKTYKRTGIIVSMIGVDSKASRTEGVNKKRNQKPIKYAHIVHKKNPWMLRAQKSTASQVLAAYRKFVLANVMKVVAKASAKGVSQ